MIIQQEGSFGTSSEDFIHDFENVIGGSGNDFFFGGPGPYTLTGGPGFDSIWGSPAGDTFVEDPSDLAHDEFHGLGGKDTVTYSSRSTDLDVTIDDLYNDGAPGEGDNIYADVECVVGGSGDDTLTGSAAANCLYGGPGDDELVGGAGSDRFFGNGGSDVIFARDGVADIVLDAGSGVDHRPRRDGVDPDPRKYP